MRILFSVVVFLPVILAQIVQERLSELDSLFPTRIGFLGATKTGSAPFLAETNEYPQKYGIPSDESLDYHLPDPIESESQSYDHNPESDESIHHYFATITPYDSIKEQPGWGIFEYGLPEKCSIKQVHLLSRHGARYPISLGRSRTVTNTLSPENIEQRVEKFTGLLEFLNDWTYNQGNSLLTNLGKRQLFEKGSNFFYRYGALYNFSSPEKLVVRTTTQSRMTDSALYFLLGFFGIDWQKYANLELIIERFGYNNTLAPKGSCPTYFKNQVVNKEERGRISSYIKGYLNETLKKLNSEVELKSGNDATPFFTFNDLLRLQEMCSYEVNNLGSSRFCSLFSQRQWEDYEYVHDWNTYHYLLGSNSKASKALGMGWVEDFRLRLVGEKFNISRLTSQNSSLVTSDIYFPLKQALYFDFSHDTTIVNILHALGLNFNTTFSGNGLRHDKSINSDYFQISRVVPFAAQVVFEVIECDEAVAANRSGSIVNQKEKYVHMLLNDHTLPLGSLFPDYCEQRLDGWCQFDSFVEHLNKLWSDDFSEGQIFRDVCYS